MSAPFPVYDTALKLIMGGENRVAPAHPCGACPDWSIYAVCHRGAGCGTDPCSEDVYLASGEPCSDAVFVWTTTDMRNLLFPPSLLSAIDGTADVEFIFDGVVVKTVTVDVGIGWPLTTPVSSGGPFSEEQGFWSFENNGAKNLSSGWHSAHASIVWRNSLDEVVSTDKYSACICVGILPDGANAFKLHDVALFPSWKTPICIDQDLAAFRILGPFHSYKDALFVRTYFADLISKWAQKCICPNECMAADRVGGWGGLSGPWPSGDTIMTEGAIAYADQGWLACVPRSTPLYVYFQWDVPFNPLPDITFYLFFYDATDEVVGEIEIGWEWSGRFTIPPCQRVEIVMSNSGGPVEHELAWNCQSSYAGVPLPDDPTKVVAENTCPDVFDGSTLEDLVPYTDISLQEWLAENGVPVSAWLLENPIL